MTTGRWCRICGQVRANEAFSGRGHRNCICRDCQSLPGAERDRIDLVQQLHGYARQTSISAKNVEHLELLATIEEPRIGEHAAVLLEIARIHPRRKHRWMYLLENHFGLLLRYRKASGIADFDGERELFGEEVMEALGLEEDDQDPIPFS